jgi:hypothetical protein
MVAFEPSRPFSCKVTAWEKAGEIVECRRQARIAKRQRDKCDAERNATGVNF